jgi:putative addiction module killer protein
MDPVAFIEIRQYATEEGRVPFREWRRALKDPATRQRVDARLGRIRGGNLGDHRDLGGGLFELRLDFGPGYRIYFTREGRTVVVLLAAGEKHGQDRDIDRARDYLRDWKERMP